MKLKFIFIIASLFIVISMEASAVVRNPFAEKRKEKALEEKAQNIILYTSLPEREFKIISDARADGVFTKNKEKILTELKVKAYKLRGDAVVGVYCKGYKSLNMSCFGQVVKWQ